jgi:hypothetical protein
MNSVTQNTLRYIIRSSDPQNIYTGFKTIRFVDKMFWNVIVGLIVT